jgi:hypothetical protein
VAHNKDGALAGDRLQLVKSGQNEDRGLSETGLGLAENIDVEDCGGDAVLLDCGEAKRWLDLISNQGEAAKKQSCRKVNVRSSVHLSKSAASKINYTTDTRTLSFSVTSFVIHGAINRLGRREAMLTGKCRSRDLAFADDMRGTPITGVTNRIDRFVSRQENRHGLQKAGHMWKQMTVVATALGHTK